MGCEFYRIGWKMPCVSLYHFGFLYEFGPVTRFMFRNRELDLYLFEKGKNWRGAIVVQALYFFWSDQDLNLHWEKGGQK